MSTLSNTVPLPRPIVLSVHDNRAEGTVGPGRRAAVEGSTTQATRAPGGAYQWRPFVAPERLDEIDSTNSELARRAAAGAPEGTVLLAERQTAGRGRLGRRWLDHPGGSILCSVLLRPAWTPERWHLAGWALMCSARDAVAEVTGVMLAGKWPNDLLAADGRKVAGVLAEAVPGGGLVVGIGLNCNWPDRFPPEGEPGAAEVAARAISLDRLAGGPVPRDAIAQRMLERLGAEWAALRPQAPAPDEEAVRSLASRYRAACGTIGEQVSVELPGEQVVGTALDVDDLGRLLVDVGACLRTVDSGDVVHLRSKPLAGGG
jgi:BirA family biotin operon repressor/biotin-[acetyl-CoA-carboxylase] ligase